MTGDDDSDSDTMSDLVCSPQVTKVRLALNELTSPNTAEDKKCSNSLKNGLQHGMITPQVSQGRAKVSNLLQDLSSSLDAANQIRTHEQFIKRIKSFSLINWTGKPLCLSPPLFAQYGWQCIGVDTVRCSVCGATVICRLPWPNAGNYRQKIRESCLNIVNGHESMCPWPNNPCSNSFLYLFDSSAITVLEKEVAVKDFYKRLMNLKTVSNSLPFIHSDICGELHICEETLIEIFDLCHAKSISSQITPGKPSPTRRSTISPTTAITRRKSLRRTSFSPIRRLSVSPKSQKISGKGSSPTSSNSSGSPSSPPSKRKRTILHPATEEFVDSHVKLSSVVLALFGWDRHDDENRDHYISCKLSNRIVGLWNFNSIKDYMNMTKDGKEITIDCENREPSQKRLRSASTKQKDCQYENKCFFHPSKQNFEWSPWCIVLVQPALDEHLDMDCLDKPNVVSLNNPGWKGLLDIMLEHAGISCKDEQANSFDGDLSSPPKSSPNTRKHKLVVDHARRLLDDMC